jgi:transcriptional regulator with XRE-family HTH domain
MTIGERIRQLRRERLWTVGQAAEFFGVSPSEISRMEHEKNKPHFVTEAKWEKKFEAIEKGEM